MEPAVTVAHCNVQYGNGWRDMRTRSTYDPFGRVHLLSIIAEYMFKVLLIGVTGNAATFVKADEVGETCHEPDTTLGIVLFVMLVCLEKSIARVIRQDCTAFTSVADVTNAFLPFPRKND